MKKYFTEYIPVEGEIKEVKGTPIYSIDGIVQFELRAHRDINSPSNILRCHDGETYKDYLDSQCKPVKLCLCSRNVKIGDKFDQLPGINGVSYICKEIANGFILDDEGKHRAIETCFKVVGDISPDALSYVKRGMEYDEDQVQGYFEKLPYDENHKALIDKALLQFKKPLVFKIRGECGYFH